MGNLPIELTTQRVRTPRNLRRWAEVLTDRELARIVGRVEIDRHGRAVVYPPAPAAHGAYQSEVACRLGDLMADGQVVIACPISTADGVRASDVAWASEASLRRLGGREWFPRAPEICIEVLSPENSAAEIAERTSLYFDAGAKEVWHCSTTGEMTWFAEGVVKPLPRSRLCPDFPTRVRLR